jgi:hypothetical protein
MNFQEKLLEASADLRSRAAALATSALETARSRADQATRRVADLKGPISVLNGASREFNKVARRHAARFVKQNSTIVAAARKDVVELARSTYASLATRPTAKKARRTSTTRKRASKAA